MASSNNRLNYLIPLHGKRKKDLVKGKAQRALKRKPKAKHA